MNRWKRPVSGALALGVLLAGSIGTMAQQEQYDEISAEMEEIRELELLDPLDIALQSRDEFQADLVTDFETDYLEEDQENDARALVAFGLLPPGSDPGDIQLELLGEQVAGYYDPETDEMVLVSSGTASNELNALDEVTFAHEVVHALQDQHFDLVALRGDLDALRDDEALAMDGLVEGDATLAQIEYIVSHPTLLAELQAEFAAEGDTASQALEDAPPVYAATLLFPYEQGFQFVQAVFDDGGWEAVNAAYADPPTSTEQILHPEKYLDREEPVAVEISDPSAALGEEWRAFDTNTMGEFLVQTVLSDNGISEEQAVEAAVGWGGDTYVVVGTEDEDVIVWRTTWDTVEDAEQFALGLTARESERLQGEPESLPDGAGVTFEGDGVFGQILIDGQDVTYVKAPDAETAETALNAALDAPAEDMATPAD